MPWTRHRVVVLVPLGLFGVGGLNCSVLLLPRLLQAPELLLRPRLALLDGVPDRYAVGLTFPLPEELADQVLALQSVV